MPRLLRLTWKGYPLHHVHSKVEKWGYSISSAAVEEITERKDYGEIQTNFPWEEFLRVV